MVRGKSFPPFNSLFFSKKGNLLNMFVVCEEELPRHNHGSMALFHVNSENRHNFIFSVVGRDHVLGTPSLKHTHT